MIINAIKKVLKDLNIEIEQYKVTELSKNSIKLIVLSYPKYGYTAYDIIHNPMKHSLHILRGGNGSDIVYANTHFMEKFPHFISEGKFKRLP